MLEIYINFQILIYTLPDVKQLPLTMNKGFFLEELENPKNYFKRKQTSEKPHLHVNAVIIRWCHITNQIT